jgi:16S rRNA (cytidine1402-2'-O)-methyltransferase
MGDDTSPRLSAALYVVATPIGNARDISLRALDVLGGVSVILAEDTRVTAKLLALHGVATRMQPLHDHNEERSSPAAIARIASGEAVALVSDAGTPLVSDPGYKLVRSVIAAGLPVIPVPGASSVLSALVVSGLPPDRFLFCGFLPPKSAERRRALQSDSTVPATLVYFETGPRLADSLADMAQIFGDRPACVARELTKRFEEAARGGLRDLALRYAAQADPPKGEMAVVVGGPSGEGPASAEMVDSALRDALTRLSVKDATQEVAESLGAPRREVYQRALVLSAERRR